MKVLVVGFPYVRERYFATFRYWPSSAKASEDKSDISFLLPRVWRAKEGKVIFKPPSDPNITTTTAYFSHSHYPVIGGLFKGIMPGLATHLWRNRRSIDIVYGCSEPTLLATLFYAVASKALGKKFVCFTWENIPYEKKFGSLSLVIHRLIMALNLQLSDGLICGNRAGADIHRRYTRIPIAVIPMNGLDPKAFERRPTEERPSHLSSAIIYSFVGAIGYRKGIHIILRALPEVLKSVPNAHLIIAGSGEYQRQVLTLIREPRLRDHVTVFSWVDHKELVRILSVSDIFVYPSIPHGGWAEQFGYAMAEASLAELPVISTQSGSIGDVVLDGRTGTLVPPDDAGQLALAMIRLGTDAQLREHFGKAGREYISENFSHQVIARKFYNFFKTLS
jgi:glycosyltransferase involved in cell wall biosynthesis